MNPLGLPWPRGEHKTSATPSILWDLRSGEAGIGMRLALSLASATILVAALMLTLGVIEHVNRVDDEHIVTGMALAGAAWCGILAWLWWSYRRWRRLLVAIFVVAGIWLITIPTAVLIGQAFRGDGFLIASCIFAGLSGTIVTIAVAAHRAVRGRPIQDNTGAIIIRCPGCGYSLVGLESCQCPECGATYTIDQLIRAQDYAALRARRVGKAARPSPGTAPRSPALPGPGLEPQPE